MLHFGGFRKDIWNDAHHKSLVVARVGFAQQVFEDNFSGFVISVSAMHASFNDGFESEIKGELVIFSQDFLITKEIAAVAVDWVFF